MWIYLFLSIFVMIFTGSYSNNISFSANRSYLDNLNTNDAKHFQQNITKCTKVEDIRLTFQEWSEIIFVSFTHSSSLTSSSSVLPLETTKLTKYLKEDRHHHHRHLNFHQLLLKFVLNKTNYDLTLRPYKESQRYSLKIVLHGHQTISKSIPKNCYFYGSSLKNKRTLPVSAFIQVCNKTSGIILLESEIFIIKSHEFELCEHDGDDDDDDKTSKSHIAFKISSTSNEKLANLDPICGTPLWKWKRFHEAEPHRADFLRNLKIGKSKNNNKSTNCLVVKLGLILDHGLLTKMNGSLEEVKHHMMILSNVLNQLLKDLQKNIQLELVHLDLWKDRDLFSTSIGVKWTLSSLVRHASTIANTHGNNIHYLHLLSGHDNSPHYGASIPDSICTDRAVGISNVENPDDIVSMAVDIIHMFGHVIGLEHDANQSEDKRCPDQKGFSMTSTRAEVLFSPISHSSSSSSFSSAESTWKLGSKIKRNNTSHHDNRHRHHHFRLGWSTCSLHDFNQNLKSRLLECLRGPCNHHHHPQESADDPSLGSRGGDDSDPTRDDIDLTRGDDDHHHASFPDRGDNELKKYFPTTCGNGILERGEECDCGDEQDCQASDPCCDYQTCLLKPWTTCRKGECCFNCSLSSINHVCRERRNSCDVPEYCTGISEDCPEDSMVLDGQPCIDWNSTDDQSNDTIISSTMKGLCYRGACRSYDHQCSRIWGRGSSKASDGCYSTFNQIGAISGHCGSKLSSTITTSTTASTITGDDTSTLLSSFGLDGPSLMSSSTKDNDSTTISTDTSVEYIKCSQRNVKCGLLQCKGGSQKPLNDDSVDVFFETTITSLGRSYQCKVLSNPLAPGEHLVEDGSPCSDGSMCISNKCIPMSDIITIGDGCPRGVDKRVCSGNGVCTDKLKCFCDFNFTGNDCSLQANKTNLPSSSVSPTDHVQYYSDNISHNNITGVGAVEVDDLKQSMNALWLVGAMSCVIVGASLILILCLICYRRKTPKLTKKQQICQLRNQSLLSKPGYETSSRVNRIISFGSLPSYRADKLRKAMKGTNQSETESEKSSKRNSAEVSIKVGKELKATYLPLPDPPDKGILKRPESKRRNRARTEDPAINTGSDVSSIPGDSVACGDVGHKRNEVVDEEMMTRSRIARRSESSRNQNSVRMKEEERKSIHRDSSVTMPDVLPKVPDHVKLHEVVNISNIDERDDSMKNNASASNDKDSKKLKISKNLTDETSFAEETGTMSSFLSASDLDSSPRLSAPAPSLCSEYSPQSLPTPKLLSSLSTTQQPLSMQQNTLKSSSEDMTSSGSTSPNSCSTFLTSLSEAQDHRVDQMGRVSSAASFLPSRKSAERFVSSGNKKDSHMSNLMTGYGCRDSMSSSCNDGSTLFKLQSGHRCGDEMSTKSKVCKLQGHSFGYSTNQASPHHHTDKVVGRDKNLNNEIFRPDPRGAYTKAPGSPGAPDDDDDDDIDDDDDFSRAIAI